MSDELESVTAIIQLIVAAFLSLYLFHFFSLFPEDLLDGPFSDVFFLFRSLPWIIVAMTVLALVSMILEVMD